MSYRIGWFDWFCLWYPPAWLILFNRHWRHYKPDPDGWNGFEFGLFLIPFGFYLALALRWVRLGFRAPRQTTIAPDPSYQKAFREEVLALIADRYFHAELHHLENLPEHEPLLLTMNHAGMCFPWDFVCLGLRLTQQRDWFVQPVAHPIFFDHPWLVWWLPAGWAQVLGGVRAEQDAFDTAMHAQRVLLYAPEGWRGLSKGWRHRYQLQAFDPSFVRLSLQHKVPILPVICIGSEALHPFTVNVGWLARRLKMPLFPISPLMVAFLLFPSMGVWAARSRLHYHLQPIWRPWAEPETQTELPRRSVLYQIAAQLRSRLQQHLDRLRFPLALVNDESGDRI